MDSKGLYNLSFCSSESISICLPRRVPVGAWGLCSVIQLLDTHGLSPHMAENPGQWLGDSFPSCLQTPLAEETPGVHDFVQSLPQERGQNL